MSDLRSRAWIAVVATVLLAFAGGIYALWVARPPLHPDSFGDWVAALGLIIGVPTAVLGVFTYVQNTFEYLRASRWKRREYVAARFDRLEEMALCKAAMRMLDYNAVHVDFDGLKRQFINDQLVMGALAPHQQRGSYTSLERAIRDAFDTFFNELDRLGAMETAGLVKAEDLASYADYWLLLFDPARRGRPPVYGAVLRRYVRVFHFEGLEGLLQRRKLMACDGRPAERQARTDDAILAAYDGSWVAPEDLAWEQRIAAAEVTS